MPAYASIEIGPVPLGRPAALVGVYRAGPDGGPGDHLANVHVLAIRYREGADAGVARFRYAFDGSGPPGAPESFQDALSVDSTGPGLVANDDRLLVIASNPDGSPAILFDGFAQVPELGLDPTREVVTFVAFGAAIREWDEPIGGALMRDADEPDVVSDVETDLVVQFNPAGRPNATPEGADAEDSSGNTYPTFLDPLVVRADDARRYWTLPMAVRHLCYRYNADQAYVANPDGDLIDAILDARAPGDPDGGSTPDDPSTYASDPLIVPNYPATGKAWPAVLAELLGPAGFGMAFRLESDDDGRPTTRLDLFRRRDGSASTLKDLYLQPRGSALDPGQSNLGAATLARDLKGVANAVTVESELARFEASFVLAPGFPIAAGDAQGYSTLTAYDRNSPGFSTGPHDSYRLYVFDETGEGHWDFDAGRMSQDVPPLDALFNPEDDPEIGYVKRRRVPIAELFTLDPNRKPLRARLSISTDYRGPSPGLWDGTGTWQTIEGGFRLLGDRLGIWIDAPTPNGWNIGPARATGMPYPAGVVKGVEDQANTAGKHFRLRLTCVIEGDRVASATADRRPSSPTTYTVARRVDARDRFARHVVAAGSEFNASSSPSIARDDTPDALAEAVARRAASEAGEVSGAVTIPRFTMAYRIGDRIASIRGRGLSLRTNAGAPSEEAEVYPAVVGLAWEFEPGQRTILQLSDQGATGR